LAGKADILLGNYKVGGLSRYGLDYASLKAIYPRLIYCSITGFGQSGPYAARAGYDFLTQGMGGLMSVTGKPHGSPGEGPVKVGVALTDIMTDMYATVSVLAALAHRDRTGQGQHIVLALLDVQIASLANQASNFLVGGDVPQPMGNAHPNVVPYQDYPTPDGFVIIAVGNDTQFAKLAATLGRPEWANDERFATNPERVKHRDKLIAQLRSLTLSRTTADWVTALEEAGVPCGPINRIDQVFADPHVQSRGMRVEMDHPLAGRIPLVANPIRMSETPIEYRRPPPTLGEHTDAVLSEWLELSPKAIASLRAKKVV
jgi:crotonobetainyl-CoA:carnitine CoA-transferase CaiB-like acyl-CoA transferase